MTAHNHIPTFSVAMATYNGERHLREQLDSIAAQTLLPCELRIGDDGSTDRTADIIAEFARSAPFPVEFHLNKPRRGYGDSFLETAKRCSGDYIAFCDQDDVWLPHKLERCHEALGRTSGEAPTLVAHAAEIVRADLTRTGRTEPAHPRDKVCGPLARALDWGPLGCTQVFRRELVCEIAISKRAPTILAKVDPYPHDWWIGILGNVLGTTIEIAQPLSLYRRHGATTSDAGAPAPRFSVSAVRSTGAEHYDRVAWMWRAIAECLDDHASRTRRVEWRERMKSAAGAYEALALAWERRARIHKEAGLVDRVKALVEGLVQPGYFGLGSSSLGTRSLMKDAAVALAPHLFRHTGPTVGTPGT